MGDTRAFPVGDLVAGAPAIFNVTVAQAAGALFTGEGAGGYMTIVDAAALIEVYIDEPVTPTGAFPSIVIPILCGDGVSSSFLIEHGLGNATPGVTIWDLSQSPPEVVTATVQQGPDDPGDTLTISAEGWVTSPPAANSILVSVNG